MNCYNFVPTMVSWFIVCILLKILDHAVLNALIWQDTRNMLADGLTKGEVDRLALREIMEGRNAINHECKAVKTQALC